MPPFSIRLTDPGLADYFKGRAQAARNVLKRGVRAALAVLRQAAIERAPDLSNAGPVGQALKSSKGYSTSADATGDLTVKGKIFSKAPGNIIESGAKAHWAKTTPAISDWLTRHGMQKMVKPTTIAVHRGGTVIYVPLDPNPRLREWLISKGVLNNDGTRPYFHQATMGPRPIVVPAAEAVQSQAEDACAETVFKAIEG